MLCVVALRPFAIPNELRLRPLPGLGIDERRHPDRDPFGLGAPGAALAITGMAIFEPAQPMWTPYIPGLRAIVRGFPFIVRLSFRLELI